MFIAALTTAMRIQSAAEVYVNQAENNGLTSVDLGPASISYSSGSAPKNAGSYTAYASYAGNSEYGSAYASAGIDIGQADLTIAAAANTKAFDSTTSATATPTVSGLQGSDTVTGLSESFTDRNAGTNKALTVNGGYTVSDGNNGHNYVVTIDNTTGVITKAPLTITAAANTKIYDSTTLAGAVPTVSGLKGGDTVTGLAEIYANGNAGSSKTLSVSAYRVGDGNGGNNYTVTKVTNTAGAINKAALSLTAQTNTKTFDATTSALLIPMAVGLRGRDTMTGLSEAYDTPSVGTGKTLSVNSGYAVSDGNSGGNYTVTTAGTATGTIGKAVPTIAFTNLSGVLGSALLVTATIAGATGVDGANPNTLDGVSLNAFTFYDADGNPLSAIPTQVGNYQVTVSFNGSPNYTAATLTGTAAIFSTAPTQPPGYRRSGRRSL